VFHLLFIVYCWYFQLPAHSHSYFVPPGGSGDNVFEASKKKKKKKKKTQRQVASDRMKEGERLWEMLPKIKGNTDESASLLSDPAKVLGANFAQVMKQMQ
jgi:hypothetical protein